MKKTNGIILAGGMGSRLWPLTSSFSKHLLPIYNKPMIYYSLSVLMLANVKDILIIVKKSDEKYFKNLLGNGSRFGINISYKIQKKPDGIASAFKIGKDFIKNNNVLLILGDNLFYGHGFSEILNKVIKSNAPTIFYHYLNNPNEYAVLEFNKKTKKPINIVEKPNKFISNYVVTGLYFYTSDVFSKSSRLKKSQRGEYEITDINKIYLNSNKLNFEELGRGFSWFDMGTIDNLLDASHFVQTVETRQGYMIGCLEEIALRNKWITINTINMNLKKNNINSEYSNYIKSIIIK